MICTAKCDCPLFRKLITSQLESRQPSISREHVNRMTQKGLSMQTNYIPKYNKEFGPEFSSGQI